MNSPQVPHFPAAQSKFYNELKGRVDAYFQEQQAKTTGNGRLYRKAAIISFCFVAIYATLIFIYLPAFLSLVLCILLGITVAGIGFNVMHDGGHKSFSQSKTWNALAANSLDFLGASSFMWKTKHNLVHHTYTNIDGIDDDMNVMPWLRLTTNQKKYPHHRFQHYYFIIFYSFLYFVWVGILDFLKYFSKKVGPFPIASMKWKDQIIFWGSKFCFLFVFVLLPLYEKGIKSYAIGFSIFMATTGIIISLVFQLAHIVDEAEFPKMKPNVQQMQDEWAVHQIKTTANFSTQNSWITWYIGGLNFQIEHHLFPRISHVHYPEISKIVKDTSQHFGIRYQEYPTLFAAIAAHVKILKRMGTTN